MSTSTTDQPRSPGIAQASPPSPAASTHLGRLRGHHSGKKPVRFGIVGTRDWNELAGAAGPGQTRTGSGAAGLPVLFATAALGVWGGGAGRTVCYCARAPRARAGPGSLRHAKGVSDTPSHLLRTSPTPRPPGCRGVGVPETRAGSGTRGPRSPALWLEAIAYSQQSPLPERVPRVARLA